MTYSALTDTRTDTPQKSSRQGAKIDTILLHHMAGTDAAGVVKLMQSGARTVSANYAIGRDGHAWGVVPEESRAWTSGSSSDGGKGAAWDRRSITFEIADEVAREPWPISEAAFQKVAAMMADISTRYGIPLDRNHVLGHRELWTRYRASYPTACPGGLDLDAITARARAIQTGATAPVPPVAPPPPTRKRDTMDMVTLSYGNTKHPLYNAIDVYDGLRAAIHTETFDEAYAIARSAGIARPGDDDEAKLRQRLRDLGLELSPDQGAIRLKAIRDAGGTIDKWFEGKF